MSDTTETDAKIKAALYNEKKRADRAKRSHDQIIADRLKDKLRKAEWRARKKEADLLGVPVEMLPASKRAKKKKVGAALHPALPLRDEIEAAGDDNTSRAKKSKKSDADEDERVVEEKVKSIQAERLRIAISDKDSFEKLPKNARKDLMDKYIASLL